MDNQENNNGVKKVVVITKQVNSSIDEEKVKETNNRIKVKETPMFIKFLIVVGCVMTIFFASFYAIKFSKSFIKAGEVTTQPSTTSSKKDRSVDYWKKDTVRRYVSDNMIYLFFPKSLYSYVYEIDYSDVENVSTTMGTYTDEEVLLTMDDVYEYSITDEGIKIGDNEYKMSSGEFKYYLGDGSILVVNASKDALQGVYVDNNRTSYSGKYMEYDDKIVLQGIAGDLVFNKTGTDIYYNGVKLTLKG